MKIKDATMLMIIKTMETDSRYRIWLQKREYGTINRYYRLVNNFRDWN